MPELPEVETTRRGIAPHLEGKRLLGAVVRERRLRRPVPEGLDARIRGRRVAGVRRRGKYLILDLEDDGGLLVHLGMSGSLRLVPCHRPPGPHDHVDLRIAGGRCLRLTDPRRFGLVLWAPDPDGHPLLRELGPEPLTADFTGAYLWRKSRGRRVAVKHFLMDGRVVAGVGNIYANEALFRAGIHPARPAGRISKARYARLAQALREVLAEAVDAGGTTLRDFTDSHGRPGYFRRALAVYHREGRPCPRCGTPIRSLRLGQRSTFYCPRCQH
ncbi:MAG: bifunctional DNA-formamidopyrimidine glycosylase/DNA-(apurinic or apyrimidinic site) lyase [Gammaproteobacteria bacterium]|nr:MAG: bifunctional DNA-formamidopyrimidine glycosylase/DNA-(apurinic or apyrimidinic site) lyase [Gammaproteobacteria bacterium]